MSTTITLDLANILDRKFPHGLHTPADVEIANLLAFANDDWLHEIDLESLLAAKQLIGIVWNTRVVLEERPDLTEDQAWQVLVACQPRFEERTDAMSAIVRDVAEQLFPKPLGKDALRAMLASIERRITRLLDDEQSDPAGYGSARVILEAIESLLKRSCL